MYGVAGVRLVTEITWVDWALGESEKVLVPVGVLRVRLAIDGVVVVKEITT